MTPNVLLLIEFLLRGDRFLSIDEESVLNGFVSELLDSLDSIPHLVQTYALMDTGQTEVMK